MASEFWGGVVGVGRASPVPRAVVSPTRIPEAGADEGAGSLGTTAGALVGSTGRLGAGAVDPTSGAGVGSGLEDGAADEGVRPVGAVGPGTIKGPRMLDETGKGTWTDGTESEGMSGGDEGETTLSGDPPVGAARCSERLGVSGVSGVESTGLGLTTGTEIAPVGPTSGPRREDRGRSRDCWLGVESEGGEEGAAMLAERSPVAPTRGFLMSLRETMVRREVGCTVTGGASELGDAGGGLS